ncbi:MAG: prenyltransferase/squalene oxidase repeat-containing protein [Pirellulales bacterium]
MDSSRFRLVLMDEYEDMSREEPISGSRSSERPPSPLRRAILNARQWLLNEQQPDGHWVGELEGDTILESEYILLLAWLGRENSDVAAKAARQIIDQQRDDGGWAMYPGGPVDSSISVKAYFALKLTGHEPSAEYMQRARRAIMANGGADKVNSFTRFYLALLGQIPYDACPVVPPELVLLPRACPINLYAMSAWTRTIVVPLSIMSACQPVRQVDPRLGIRELFIRQPQDWPYPRCPGLQGGGLWNKFFRGTDWLLKAARQIGFLPLRKRALAKAERWMIDRFQHSEGLGAIFPPMIWSVIALRCLGYGDDSPELRYCFQQLDGLLIEEEGRVRLQPCKSPVWDTAIALRAVLESGVEANRPAARRAAGWLLDKEVRQPGDWSRTTACLPAGWFFEYANEYYPDLDDTAMVAMALAQQFRQPEPGEATSEKSHALPPGLDVVDELEQGDAHEDGEGLPVDCQMLERSSAAIARAQRWMLAMQNRDGGWGAFDRDNDKAFLCHVPFADHNAMIDPSTPDLTARVLEALAALGKRRGDRSVDRAVQYLLQTQEADGSWFGRWGVNYIYGTWQVLTGLMAVGMDNDHPAVKAGVNWLLSYQQPSGAWGESPDSYADPSQRGQGPCTPSQTAWAVLGLIAAGEAENPAVVRGIRWLTSHQLVNGSWDEPEFTGTGFPQVFYLRYHLYRVYFPLLALARWSTALGDRHDLLAALSENSTPRGAAPDLRVADIDLVMRNRVSRRMSS